MKKSKTLTLISIICTLLITCTAMLGSTMQESNFDQEWKAGVTVASNSQKELPTSENAIKVASTVLNDENSVVNSVANSAELSSKGQYDTISLVMNWPDIGTFGGGISAVQNGSTLTLYVAYRTNVPVLFRLCKHNVTFCFDKGTLDPDITNIVIQRVSVDGEIFPFNCIRSVSE